MLKTRYLLYQKICWNNLDVSFADCYKLASVKLPEGVKAISTNLFRNCRALESVELSQYTESIGEGAFSGCSSLKAVLFPASVTAIGNRAFSGCRGLQSITMQNPSPVVIEKSCFGSVNKEITVTVPQGSEAKYGEAPVWCEFKNLRGNQD